VTPTKVAKSSVYGDMTLFRPRKDQVV